MCVNCPQSGARSNLNMERTAVLGNMISTSLNSACMSSYSIIWPACPPKPHIWRLIGLFTPGINTHLGWSDHKRSAKTDCCSELVLTCVPNESPVPTCKRVGQGPFKASQFTWRPSWKWLQAAICYVGETSTIPRMVERLKSLFVKIVLTMLAIQSDNNFNLLKHFI